MAAGPSTEGTSTRAAEAKIKAYLTTHDVADAQQLRALSPTPEKSLMAIVSDSQAEGLIRARAVSALRLLPSPAIRDYLGKLVETKAKAVDANDRLIVRRAAVALGWLAAPKAPEQLAQLYANDDADVRLDATIGLGLTRAADAVDVLRQQLLVETVPRVRDQIQRQLHVLTQTPTPEPEKTDKPEKAPKNKEPLRGSW
jgi:HEAT repeat protein